MFNMKNWSLDVDDFKNCRQFNTPTLSFHVSTLYKCNFFLLVQLRKSERFYQHVHLVCSDNCNLLLFCLLALFWYVFMLHDVAWMLKKGKIKRPFHRHIDKVYINESRVYIQHVYFLYLIQDHHNIYVHALIVFNMRELHLIRPRKLVSATLNELENPGITH